MVVDPYKEALEMTDFERKAVKWQKRYCIGYPDQNDEGCGRQMLLLSYQINRANQQRKRVRWGYYCPDCDKYYRVYEDG